jgi:hypothetical protein
LLQVHDEPCREKSETIKVDLRVIAKQLKEEDEGFKRDYMREADNEGRSCSSANGMDQNSA